MKITKRTLNNADEMTKDLAYLMVGRLRKVSTYTLAKLKKELEQFNAKTKEWKS